MKTYLITVTLSDGSEVRSRVAAESTEHAKQRLLSLDLYKNFIAQLDVVKMDVREEGEVVPVEADRFAVYENQPRSGYYTIVDKKTNYIVEWQKGDFNGTQRITAMPVGHDPLREATILREIGEFLEQEHKDVI